MAADRGLFRELQLRRGLSLPCLARGTTDLAAEPGGVRRGARLPYRPGSYGDLALDGLNVVLAAQAPGPMADGNWAVAAYVDERADDLQTAALGAIFTGAEGGPMAAFAPLVGTQLGLKKVPISYTLQGKSRSVEIPGIMQMAVEPLPTMHPSGEIWTALGHPVAPDRLALAVGRQGSTFSDYGMRWDNSGRNGHYAPIRWSN